MSRPLPAPPAAVLFDLDGTLVDSEPIHHRSTNAFLAPHGHQLGWDDYARYIGMSEDAYLAELKQRFDLPESVPELVSLRTRAHAEILGGTRLPLLPGMGDVLGLLSQTRTPLAIASAAPRAQILATLRAAGIHDFFTTVVSGHDDVPNSKPAPDVYLEAARRLDADAAQCIAIEDSPYGLHSARAASCWTLAIPSPGVSPTDLAAADRILSDGHQLLELLRTCAPG